MLLSSMSDFIKAVAIIDLHGNSLEKTLRVKKAMVVRLLIHKSSLLWSLAVRSGQSVAAFVAGASRMNTWRGRLPLLIS